jgi:hypothetical protein
VTRAEHVKWWEAREQSEANETSAATNLRIRWYPDWLVDHRQPVAAERDEAA